MLKFILLSILFFFFSITAIGQAVKYPMLFIIDSIPQKPNYKALASLSKRDIADMYVVKDKDSLVSLGYSNYVGIAYIFTKAYRTRPDSIKAIPSTNQMLFSDEVWYWHDIPYSGKFINYFINGKILSEGTLVNGKPNGESITYFANGNKKAIMHYEKGVLNGSMNTYYANGKLLFTGEYLKGKKKYGARSYFINGQLQSEIKQGNRRDTSITWHSTGKINKIRLVKKGDVVLTSDDEYVSYYNNLFYQGLRMDNMRQANKCLMKILALDSTSEYTYYKAAVLMLEELRFDKAIEELDKALAIEPLFTEALVLRTIARIKKQLHIKTKSLSENINSILTVEDFATIPINEQNIICKDLLLAQEIDFTDSYVKNKIPEDILKYCRQDSGL
jgi:tetratricopeptide (TPR) repeat protein